MWTDAPPFERGNSWVNGGIIDTVNDPLPGPNLEGHEYVFPDTVYGTGVPGQGPSRAQHHGGPRALPGRLYAYDPAYPRRRLLRQTNIASEEGWPVDEFCPPRACRTTTSST
jgi:hypothetical protein